MCLIKGCRNTEYRALDLYDGTEDDLAVQVRGVICKKHWDALTLGTNGAESPPHHELAIRQCDSGGHVFFGPHVVLERPGDRMWAYGDSTGRTARRPKRWCYRCAANSVNRRCPCGRRYRSHELDYETLTFNLINASPLCSRCEAALTECVNCGRKTDKHNIMPTSEACIECAHIYQKHEWNYKPESFIPLGDSTNKLLFGIELEVFVGDVHKDKAEYSPHIVMSELMNAADSWGEEQLYFMHDGTVDPGFEVVTHPMTWRKLDEHKLWRVVDSLPKYVDIKQNNRFTKSGVHIHMSRASLQTNQIFKMMHFCYNNTALLTFLGKRKLNEFCGSSSRSKDFSFRLESQDCELSKYELINLKHRSTVEFRWFNSIIDAGILRGYVEFLHALRLWTRKLRGLEEVTADNFISFCTSRDYPNLNADLKNYLTLMGE